MREVWPERLPLFLRLSCTDWAEGGFDIEQSIEVAKMVKPLGVDLIDCSSGGNIHGAKIPAGPGYQTTFAAEIRAKAGIATGAVGFITDPAQAESIIRTGQADIVLLARENLRNPNWPLMAAKQLGAEVKGAGSICQGLVGLVARVHSINKCDANSDPQKTIQPVNDKHPDCVPGFAL